MAENEQSEGVATAEKIRVVDAVAAVRKRPGMYIGDLDERAKLRMLGLLIDDFFEVVETTQSNPEYVPHSFLTYRIVAGEWSVSLAWQSDENACQVDVDRHLDPSRLLWRKGNGFEGCFIVNCLSARFTLDAKVPGVMMQHSGESGKTTRFERQPCEVGRLSCTITARFVPDTTLLGGDVPNMMVLDGFVFGRSDAHRGIVINKETRH